LRRYRDFCDFQDGGRRHVGFSKIRNFYGGFPVGCQYVSLRQISSKSVTRLQKNGDFAAVRHLGFSEIGNFNGRSAVRVQYASLYQISPKSVKLLQRYGDLTFFSDGGHPPSWICWALIGTTHDDHLMVSIVVQNLVEIDAGVPIT